MIIFGIRLLSLALLISALLHARGCVFILITSDIIRMFFLLAIDIFLVFIAINLFNLKEWARKTFLAFLWPIALLACFVLYALQSEHGFLGFSKSGFLLVGMVLIPLIAITVFLNLPATRRKFENNKSTMGNERKL